MAKAKELLFTPFTVTRFAMNRNHTFACFRAAKIILPVAASGNDSHRNFSRAATGNIYSPGYGSI